MKTEQTCGIIVEDMSWYRAAESRKRDRCGDCGDHREAHDYDVRDGYDVRDVIVWCRQCHTWVSLDKKAVSVRSNL